MEKYLFAAYIFLLGLLLVFVFLRGLKKQSKLREDVEAEERKLIELQIDLQDTILAMETKVDETLKDIAAHRKSIEELAERIERKTAAREDLLKYGAQPLAGQPIAPPYDPPAKKSILRLRPSAQLNRENDAQ